MTEATQASTANGAAARPPITLNDGPPVTTADDRNAIIAAVLAQKEAREAKTTETTSDTPASTPSLAEAASDEAAAEETEETAEASGAEGDEQAAAETDEQAEAAKPKAAETAATDRAARLRAFLSDKEAAAPERARVQQSAQDVIARAEREANERAAKIIKDAEERAQKAAIDVLEKLRKSPLDAARFLGVDPEKVLAAQAEDTDPVQVMARKFEAAIAERDKKLEEQGELLRRIVQRDEESQKYQATVAQHAVEARFLKEAEAPEYKAAAVLWGAEGVLQKAKALVAQGHATVAKKRELDPSFPAFEATNEEILALLTERAKEETRSKRAELMSLLQEVEGVAESTQADSKKANDANGKKPAANAATSGKQANGRAPAGQGQGTRILSASAGSERRAPPAKSKDRELSDAEARKNAIKEIERMRRERD